MRYLIKKFAKRFQLFLDRIIPGNHLLLDRDWYKDEIGGKWDEIGEIQYEFLKVQGMKPSSYLIDIGCGSLRGGRFFIDYLEPEHYYGIDKEDHILQAGREKVIEENDLDEKKPNLRCIKNFDFDQLDQKFDYALAQSVFTHLPPEKVKRCLEKTHGILKPEGEFYATYYLSEEDVQIGSKHSHRKEEYNECFYPVNWFKKQAEIIGYNHHNIGNWGHPRDQKMICFEKEV